MSGNSSLQNAPPCDPTRSVMTTSAPASRSARAHRVAFSRKNGSCTPATRYARGSELGITAGVESRRFFVADPVAVGESAQAAFEVDGDRARPYCRRVGRQRRWLDHVAVDFGHDRAEPMSPAADPADYLRP